MNVGQGILLGGFGGGSTTVRPRSQGDDGGRFSLRSAIVSRRPVPPGALMVIRARRRLNTWARVCLMAAYAAQRSWSTMR